ncbi:uncharacterized protein TrAFT101_002280 [Trichoderma asperellum]|uniref:NmrA-like domain-containing protein n=1 Tax=Trichoderma asperellum (strain ATCC 204424 / CBS 433.97 / NBRC 101777) TaxID=1042311 RepID=A0A2T3ZFY5_TRIA4|nr:hypothetical protein M441DRAFT_45643 [Trichoderma asperellum CBS 433.97]PTB43728.1 hypothetical protein M441DRAFT_45643 [Trichoderma asperellum CBS 433.97]UKZ86449.1 hypothetical protein TrAFT101_002280 [Trichoderma asperellum]
MALSIAIAGATGKLGLPIVMAPLAAGYHVTAFTRQRCNNASKLLTRSNLSVIEVDYSSIQSLSTPLKGHAVIVSAPTSTSVDDQIPLIDDAIKSRVTKFIPSEFDNIATNSKGDQLPMFEGKVKTHPYLEAVIAKNPDFSCTVICNGAFLDCGLDSFLIDDPRHIATVYNSGDIPFTATRLDIIGNATVGVIKHLFETANRPIYIQDAVVTKNTDRVR